MEKLFNGLVIFEDFSKEDVDLVIDLFSFKSYESDEIVVKQNEVDKRLFLVLSGKVVSTLKIQGSIERKHGEFVRGDFFGEISLFGNRPAFDTYVTAEKSEIAYIKEMDILNLMENNSVSAIKFISKLLSLTILKLRKSNKFFADVVQWGENASRRVITDDLTGIYNRAFLEDALDNFFTISKNNNKPLSFFMLDVDNFRNINEVFGLDIGNKIIQDLVVLVKNIISRHGIIARYGGDEFSILLPETDLIKAKLMAEHIRTEVEKFDFSKHLTNHFITVTLSIGISSYPETADDLATFKKKADESLYMAKKLGRNRVECVD